jgi:hypothetical protein
VRLIPAALPLVSAGWVLTRGSRRLLDEMVFALHLVAAFLLYVPSLVPALVYVAAADRHVHGGAWWVAIPRALIFTTVALTVIWAVLLLRLG